MRLCPSNESYKNSVLGVTVNFAGNGHRIIIQWNISSLAFTTTYAICSQGHEKDDHSFWAATPKNFRQSWLSFSCPWLHIAPVELHASYARSFFGAVSNDRPLPCKCKKIEILTINIIKRNNLHIIYFPEYMMKPTRFTVIWLLIASLLLPIIIRGIDIYLSSINALHRRLFTRSRATEINYIDWMRCHILATAPYSDFYDW